MAPNSPILIQLTTSLPDILDIPHAWLFFVRVTSGLLVLGVAEEDDIKGANSQFWAIDWRKGTTLMVRRGHIYSVYILNL